MELQKKISKRYVLALLAFAALFDILSLIPLLNEAVAILGQLVMGALFYFAGVRVWDKKPAVLYILTTIAEAIPAAASLPFFLVETLAIIALERPQKA